MSTSEIWHSLFCQLGNYEQPIFIGFELVNGGGGFRFLPDRDCFNDEGYSTETEELSYAMIKNIKIPESYSLGVAEFTNDIDGIFQKLCMMEGVLVVYKDQKLGPMKGRFLEIAIS